MKELAEEEWQEWQHSKRVRRWNLAWDALQYFGLALLVYVYWWLLW